MSENKYGEKMGRVGVIGRFKPLHLGGARMLDAICEHATEVIIGIGSSNRYGLRSPFTVEETEGMLRAYLEPRYTNFTIIPVPDYGHVKKYADGKKWVENTVRLYGALDVFVSGNPYVTKLLAPHYTIIHPATLIPKENHIMLCATDVRQAMARHQEKEWRTLVPNEVASYLDSHGLVERFRKEFGLETLARGAQPIYRVMDELAYEQKNIIGSASSANG